MFPPIASAAAYSFAVGTSESAVLQALRPLASTILKNANKRPPNSERARASTRRF